MGSIVNSFVVILSLLYVQQYAQSAKILCIFNAASPSHYFLGNAYLRALAEAGHDVTMVSPYEEKNPPKNGSYRDVVLTGAIEAHKKMMGSSVNLASGNAPKPFLMLLLVSVIGKKVEDTLNHPNFQKLINSGEKFDVVVVEEFFNSALKVVAQHFNAPLISFSTQGANFMVNSIAANEAPKSYIPETLLGYSPEMTLFERLENSLFALASSLVTHLIFYPGQAKLAHQYFPHTNFYDALYNNSIIFLNSHESINTAVPAVPSMIQIGGFHIKESKPLPKDLQEFCDSAKDGVIYFSLGSNLKSKDLPVEMRNGILTAFSKLKQKVLWKFEDDSLTDLPKNVKISNWLPQQDILAHPNVKIFITHGGLLSTIETVYFGVPIIAIPIFADQKLNAKTAEINKYGKVIQISNLSEQTMSEAIQEVISNPMYSENAKTRSLIMRDRERKPIDSAVYWTEYVIRHRGAKHLHVHGLHLPFYQYYLMDVALIVGALLLVSTYITCKVLKFLINKCRRSKTEKVKKN